MRPSRRRLFQLLTGLVAVAAVVGTAIAQERGPKKVHRFEVDPEIKKAFEAQESRADQHPELPGVVYVGDPLSVRGRIEAVVDAHVLLSVALDAETLAKPSMARTVEDPSQIGDNVIYQGRLYVLYAVAPDGPANLDQALSREAELELVRDDHDVARVRFVRFP